MWQTAIGLALIAGIYTAFGGLKAVVYTDAIQAVILIIGCTVMSFIVFGKLEIYNPIPRTITKYRITIIKSILDMVLLIIGDFSIN